MSAQSSAAPIKPHAKPKTTPINPARPLKNAKRELFCSLVARGLTGKEAYERAGYTGDAKCRWELRHAPEVEARIEWMLEQRVLREAAREHRPEKSERDMRLRVLKRLERIALGDGAMHESG